MRIKNVVPSPCEESLLPSICFDVEISRIKYQEAIVGVSGWVKTDDKKIIASLNEKPQVIPSTKIEEVGAKGTFLDEHFKKGIYETIIVATLDRRALDHIEKRRKVNKKGDVKLTLCLNVKCIESTATVSPLFLVNPKDHGLNDILVQTSRRQEPGKLVIYRHDTHFNPNINVGYIISGQNSQVFLLIKEQIVNEYVTIFSSNWIHDYAPKLELGEYFIVEIPKGEKTIEKAWNHIEKAEESFRRWNIKGVYANCREVGYLLDKILKQKFGKSTFNYKERWSRTYGKFEHFASLHLHLEEIKQGQQYVAEDITLEKADAEHILTMTKLLIKYAEELMK